MNVTQACSILCDAMDYTVHGILQATILDWVAFPFSRGASQPNDQIQVSHIAGKFFTSWGTREAPSGLKYSLTQLTFVEYCFLLGIDRGKSLISVTVKTIKVVRSYVLFKNKKLGFLLQVYSFSGGLVILPRGTDTLVISFQTSIDHVEENLLANELHWGRSLLFYEVFICGISDKITLLEFCLISN